MRAKGKRRKKKEEEEAIKEIFCRFRRRSEKRTFRGHSRS